MGGESGVSFWREIIFLVQVYLNLAEKQANGPKGVQITLNFSIKGINKHFCFRPRGPWDSWDGGPLVACVAGNTLYVRLP